MLLHRMLAGEPPSPQEVQQVFEGLMAGSLDPAYAGAFLALQMRNGIDADQLEAGVGVMMAHAKTLSLSDPKAIDNCGTGGDGGGSFNVSTTAAFVVAGAGHTVAKHGNRAVSSKCGSADLLEAIGVGLDLQPDQVRQCIDATGIGFMFAPMFHPAVKNVVPIRKALGVRTIFNMLGPLLNPAQVRCQLIGVFQEELTDTFGQVLAAMGRRACVVWGEDGSDEVSLTTRTKVTEVRDGEIESHIFDPRRHGFSLVQPLALDGGTLEKNLAVFRSVLERKEAGPCADLVILNAGFAMYTSGEYDNLDEAFSKARDSIESGQAWAKVEALKAFTSKFQGS